MEIYFNLILNSYKKIKNRKYILQNHKTKMSKNVYSNKMARDIEY
jgi:hypothetical protein